MNPWAIVSWIGAVCVAILIVSLTISIVVSAAKSTFKPKVTNQKVTTILDGR